LANAPVAADRPLDGESRWDVLSGARTLPTGTERFVFHDCGETNAPLLALRLGAWKCHLSLRSIDPENTFAKAVPPLLFQLNEDPFEIFELSAANTTALAIATNAAQTWLGSLSSDPGQLPPPAPPFASPLGLAGDDLASLQLIFTRPYFSDEQRYWLAWSTNLVSWDTVPLQPQIASVTPLSAGLETVHIRPYFSSPLPTATFYRVRYVSP
jgi:hypothetical protein